MSNPHKKPAIVLLHGFRGAPIGLEAVAEELRNAGFQVLTPPVPPFANARFSDLLASHSNNNFTTEAYADYFAAYIKKQNLQQPIIIGHSMGSIVASSLAAKHPKLIAKDLILLSPISEKPSRFFASLTPLCTVLPRSLVDYITTKFLFIPKNRQLLKQTLELTHQCSTATDNKKLVFSAAKFSTKYCVADFDLSRSNVHLIAGNQDRLISPRSTIALANKLQITPIFLPDTGHLHNYEKPKETAEEIIKIID